MTMASIRMAFRVPARRGCRIRYGGPPLGDSRLGTVTGSRGDRLRVRFDGENRTVLIHPAWAVIYLEDNAAWSSDPS